MQVSKRPAKSYMKGKDFTSDPEEIQEVDGSRETASRELRKKRIIK